MPQTVNVIPQNAYGALPDGSRVYLTRRDDAHNMARFYTMALQATLFRECSLIREWGRLGRGGQTLTQTFPTIEDAQAAMSAICREKIKRGYVGTSSL